VSNISSSLVGSGNAVCSYVFLLGDFNFRMDELSADEVKSRIAAGDLQSLWPYDQVTDAWLIAVKYVSNKTTSQHCQRSSQGQGHCPVLVQVKVSVCVCVCVKVKVTAQC